MRSYDNGDDMSTMVSTVLSGFEYRYQKEKYDNLTKYFKENEKNITIQVLLVRQFIKPKMLDIKTIIII